MKSPLFESLSALLGVIILLFLILPLASITIRTTPSEILKTLTEKEVIESIAVTFWSALIATVFGTITGIPLAYLTARKKNIAFELIEAGMQVPIIIPHSAAGIALLSVFGSQKLESITGVSFMGSVAGISAAMTFVSVPFLYNSAVEAFRSVAAPLEQMARACGDGPFRSFFKITLPLATRGIISGMIMMWARGISEFGAVIIIAYHPMIAPVLIYERFTSFGLDYARPVAVIMLFICSLIFMSLFYFTRRRKC